MVEVRNDVKHKSNEKCIIKLDDLKENEVNAMKLNVNEETELNVNVVIKYKFNISGNKGGTDSNEVKAGTATASTGGGFMSRLKMFDKSFKGTNASTNVNAVRNMNKSAVNVNAMKVNVESNDKASHTNTNTNSTVKNESKEGESTNVNNSNSNNVDSNSNCNATTTTTNESSNVKMNVSNSSTNNSVCNSSSNSSAVNAEGTENVCRSGMMSVLQQAKMISQQQSAVKKDGSHFILFASASASRFASSASFPSVLLLAISALY